MKEAKENSCEREQDLLVFMYQELNEVEELAFQRHLKECASCRSELSNFRDVRESVITWRNQSFANIGLVANSAISSSAPLKERKRSAVAAVREFLNLSPLWMKGAVAFATIVFCMLAVIAVTRLRQKQPTVIASAPVQPPHSQEEIEAIVKQRVQEELRRIKNSRSSEMVATADDMNHTAHVPKRVSRNFGSSNLSYSARRPLSKTERQQLATDLRLFSSNSDSDLDLLQDRINQ